MAMGLYIIHMPLEYRKTIFRLGLGVLRDRYESNIRLLHTTNLNSGCDNSPVSKLGLMGRSSGYFVSANSTSWFYGKPIEAI